MAVLSIVLPVYGVAGYLAECLDSILAYDGGDLEVVAVDDASTDGCAAILDEYAGRDPRIRVLHLEQNVGLGEARNVGTAAATGDYVWYVDSDDWLTPGAVRAVLRRLAETTPQVLLVDYARVNVTGQAQASALNRHLPPETTPDVFAAVDDPKVIWPLHTAWSRVWRRDWLAERGLRFQPVWYEDVSFVFPLTCVADRISVLYRVCYNYRQRRHGSITRSYGDDRHFEMFSQYELVFDALDAWGVTDTALRQSMYERALQHYRYVMGATERLPLSRRREFFARTAADMRRFRPSGMPQVGGLEGLRRRLIERDAWVAFSGFRVAKDGLAGGQALARRTASAGREVLRRGYRVAVKGYYALQRRLPLDPRLALYGAYWGMGLRCNPAAIYHKAAELAPSVHGVWLVKREHIRDLPKGTRYVRIGSPKAYRAMARAKYLLNNVNFPADYRKRQGSVLVQTHHGTPLKAMGMDHVKYPVGARGMNLTKLLERCDNWDVSISTSPFNTAVWQRAYPCRHETIQVGYPRNDRLVTAGPEEIARIRTRLGVGEGETTVLFAPTHRDYQGFFDPFLDVEALADALGEGVRILMRAHHFYDTGVRGRAGGGHPRVLDVSAHPHVEDLYLASDVLITDYSSVMFDYAVLDRPIAIFAPDWETYKLTRGVTFDLMARPPGVVASSFEELVDAFRSGEVRGDAAAKVREHFRERFCPYDDGRASERVVRHVFLGEQV